MNCTRKQVDSAKKKKKTDKDFEHSVPYLHTNITCLVSFLDFKFDRPPQFVL